MDRFINGVPLCDWLAVKQGNFTSEKTWNKSTYTKNNVCAWYLFVSLCSDLWLSLPRGFSTPAAPLSAQYCPLFFCCYRAGYACDITNVVMDDEREERSSLQKGKQGESRSFPRMIVLEFPQVQVSIRENGTHTHMISTYTHHDAWVSLVYIPFTITGNNTWHQPHWNVPGSATGYTSLFRKHQQAWGQVERVRVWKPLSLLPGSYHSLTWKHLLCFINFPSPVGICYKHQEAQGRLWCLQDDSSQFS